MFFDMCWTEVQKTNYSIYGQQNYMGMIYWWPWYNLTSAQAIFGDQIEAICVEGMTNNYGMNLFGWDLNKYI